MHAHLALERRLEEPARVDQDELAEERGVRRWSGAERCGVKVRLEHVVLGVARDDVKAERVQVGLDVALRRRVCKDARKGPAGDVCVR